MVKTAAIPLKLVPTDTTSPLQEFQTSNPDVVPPLYGGTGLTTADLTGNAGKAVVVNSTSDGFTVDTFCRWRGTIATTATHPTTPSEGDIYYNSADVKIRIYAGGSWVDLN